MTNQSESDNLEPDSFLPLGRLYVSNLDTDKVNEDELTELFSTYGYIVSIKIPINSVTFKPFGYAYVNYNNEKSANEAIKQLNLKKLGNKEINVMWCSKDKFRRYFQDVGNLFIDNLPFNITQKKLSEIFSRFGKISSCKINSTEDKSFAYVKYETEVEASEAIKNLNKCEINGKPIYVGKFIPKSDRLEFKDKARPNKNKIKILARNLDPVVTKEILSDLFKSYGEIISIELKYSDECKTNYALILFADKNSGERAINDLNGHNLYNRILKLSKCVPTEIRNKNEESNENNKEINYKLAYAYIPNNVLYIGNLGPHITNEIINDLFNDFGVQSYLAIRIVRDGAKESRKFGFVRFPTIEDAKMALNEATEPFKRMNITLKFADPYIHHTKFFNEIIDQDIQDDDILYFLTESYDESCQDKESSKANSPSSYKPTKSSTPMTSTNDISNEFQQEYAQNIANNYNNARNHNQTQYDYESNQSQSLPTNNYNPNIHLIQDQALPNVPMNSYNLFRPINMIPQAYLINPNPNPNPNVFLAQNIARLQAQSHLLASLQAQTHAQIQAELQNQSYGLLNPTYPYYHASSLPTQCFPQTLNPDYSYYQPLQGHQLYRPLVQTQPIIGAHAFKNNIPQNLNLNNPNYQ